MIITLIRANRLTSMTLPEKISGRFWVSYCNAEKKIKRLISIDGVDEKWVLKGNRSVEILEDGKPLKSTELKPHRVYPLVLEGATERALLLTEPRTVDRSTYQ